MKRGTVGEGRLECLQSSCPLPSYHENAELPSNFQMLQPRQLPARAGGLANRSLCGFRRTFKVRETWAKEVGHGDADYLGEQRKYQVPGASFLLE